MSNRIPFVVYWNNIPAPYMVDRFNALADRGAFEFEAWFTDREHADRSWNVEEAEWRFRFRYLPSVTILGRKFHWPAPLFARRPDFLVSLYSEPVYILGWAIAKLRGCRTGFRVLLTHDSWVRRHPLKNLLKRFLFSRVDAIETPGMDGRKFAIACGASPDRIFIATHTVDMRNLRSKSFATSAERETFRKQLKVSGVTFIYVGRLWSGKGIDSLLAAFGRLEKQCGQPVSLLLVGDGYDEARFRNQCAEAGISNVIFAGFQQKVDLPAYYAIADVFVFPTLGDPYGIVVDEAMACGLPIISTSAAGEIGSRVRNDVNGYIVPPSDVEGLAAAMRAMASDEGMRKRMGEASKAMVEGHTPAQWAIDFEKMVQGTLGSSGR